MPKLIRLTPRQILMQFRVLLLCPPILYIIINNTTSGLIIMISLHRTPVALQFLAAVLLIQKLVVPVLVMHILAPSHLHRAPHNGKVMVLHLLHLLHRQREAQGFKASTSTRYLGPQAFKASTSTKHHAPQGFKTSMSPRHQVPQGFKTIRSTRNQEPQVLKTIILTRHLQYRCFRTSMLTKHQHANRALQIIASYH